MATKAVALHHRIAFKRYNPILCFVLDQAFRQKNEELIQAEIRKMICWFELKSPIWSVMSTCKLLG